MLEARESAARWDKRNKSFTARFTNFIRGRAPLFGSLTAQEAQDQYEIDWPAVIAELGFMGEERFFPTIEYVDMCSACHVQTRPKSYTKPQENHEFVSYNLYINPYQFSLYPEFVEWAGRTFSLMDGARFLMFHEVRHAWQYLNEIVWYERDDLQQAYVGHFNGVQGIWPDRNRHEYMALPWEQDANNFALSMLSKYPASS